MCFLNLYYDEDLGYCHKTYEVNLEDDVSSLITVNSFYEIKDIGSVDYYKGEVSYNGEISAIKYESASYKSSSSKNYMKLDESVPVVWK